jgi:asparagine synthase (glutamine-hydrolysing)
MCGIAGLLGIPPGRAEAAAARMLAAMQHRGPDDSGIEVVAGSHGEPPAVLVHARLAILDLTSAGHQPQADRPGRPGAAPNWITFNGEVFNYADLHGELAAAGWPCRTRCDTEVILHAYRVWGEAAVERFRGMFTWCLLDPDRGTAWLCRDRLGIKPLYLSRAATGGLLFASEVRTLLAAGPELVTPRVSPAALESFLAQGAVCGLESIIEGVELLPPGTSLCVDWQGKPLRRRTYWTVPFVPPNGAAHTADADRPHAVARLAECVRQSVRLRLLADVPLGLFLSGGIDSAALATVATEVAGTEVQTLSIGFDQPQFDETAAAEQVAAALGTRHRTLRLRGTDVLHDLPAVLAAVDQPSVDGFNTYFVARAARRAGLTVALSGVGGDELFGGYASFRDVPRALAWHRRLRPLGGAGRLAARALGRALGRAGAKAGEALARDGEAAQLYLLRRELFLPRHRRALHPLPGASDPASGVPRAVLEELRQQAAGLDAINQVSYFELSAYLRHMLLRDADVFGMAHGLEIRVPLLDHRLVELAASLPGSLKRPDPRPKPLLLDAVGPRLPRLVYTLPKRGFTFPWDGWLRGPLRGRAVSILKGGDVWQALGIAADAPSDLWARFEAGDRRVTGLQVLALVVLADYAARHGLRVAA